MMFGEVTKFLDKMIELGVPGTDCIVYKSGNEVYRHMLSIYKEQFAIFTYL